MLSKHIKQNVCMLIYKKLNDETTTAYEEETDSFLSCSIEYLVWITRKTQNKKNKVKVQIKIRCSAGNWYIGGRYRIK